MTDSIVDKADRPVLELDEIEVTPEMIEAGVDALSGRYLELSGGWDLFPQIVENLYRRMEEARRTPLA